MAWYPGKNIVQGIRNIGSNIMDNRREKQALQNRAMGPTGPAPQNNVAMGYSADRGAQGEALQMARQGMTGPSMAGMQAMQGAQQNVVDQMGMASMGSGGSLAAQQRQAAAIGSAGAMAGNRDAAMATLAERQAQQAAFTNQANTMAGMSAGAMGQNADIATQWGLGQRGMDLQALNQRQQYGLGIADRVIGAGMGAGQMAMFSDENLKTDVTPDEDAASNTLASLAPVRYRYKNERHGPTEEETVGFLAQDLERTPMGKRLVKEIPGEGKAVDVPGLVSLLTAHGSGVEQRLRSLEGRR